MAGIPQNFSAISNVLANYNFVDIVAGTGIINFYAGSSVDLLLLSNHEFYSEPILHTYAIANAMAAQLAVSIDFDVYVNRPLNIFGKTILNVPLSLSASSASHAYIIARVYKQSGGVETEICNNTSNTYDGAAAITYKMSAIDLDMALTHFKIGDILRLTLDVWAYNTVSAAHTVSIGHDPMNRTTGWDATGAVPSKLTFQVPVRLNL